MHSLQFLLGKMGKFAAFAGVASAALWQPFRPMIFVGASMAPTYHNGECVITVPADGPLHRGDVVVVNMPDGPIVKRVTMLPGDELVQMKSASGWVDLTEVKLAKNSSARVVAMCRKKAIPDGYVYVVGDNRPVSFDSRVFGAVPREWITRKLLDNRPPAKPNP